MTTTTLDRVVSSTPTVNPTRRPAGRTSVELGQSKCNERKRDDVECPMVLCIDDDPDFQSLLEMQLKQYVIELQHAYHGMHGAIIASTRKPDIILMDQVMPYGNGEYLLEALMHSEETRHVPVLVLTGARCKRLARKLICAGAKAVLHKPFSMESLVSHMRRYIRLEEHQAGEACGWK